MLILRALGGSAEKQRQETEARAHTRHEGYVRQKGVAAHQVRDAAQCDQKDRQTKQPTNRVVVCEMCRE